MTTAKAVVGSVVAGLGTILTALTTGDRHVTAAVVVAAVIAALVAYGAVWGTSNKPASDKGETFAGFLYIVALLVVIAAGATYLIRHWG